MKPHYSFHFRRICILLLFIFLGTNSIAQCWTRVADFPGANRRNTTGFEIDGLGYVCLGGTGVVGAAGHFNDLWAYNPNSNTWTQKANFPGSSRRNCFSFVLNGEAYVGNGWNNLQSFNSIYKYSPSSNTWSTISNYPGNGRRNNFAVSVNGKGYVGGGAYTAGTARSSDQFYEFDPTSNLWISKGIFPFGTRSAGISISFNGKVYFGLGVNQGNYFSDLWSYEPTSQTWTQLASFPGAGRMEASYFMFNGEFIVGGGTGPNGSIAPFRDYYAYNPNTNTWRPISGFSLGGRSRGAYFSAGNGGFISTGYYNGSNQKDTWKLSLNHEFSTDTIYICQGAIHMLDVTTSSATYLWNDNSSSPRKQIAAEGKYWVDVTVNGCVSTDTIYAKFIDFNIDLGNDTSICQGNILNLDVTQAGASYLWQDNSTSSSFTVQQSGLYWVAVDINGCMARDSIRVDFENYPIVNLGKDTILCTGSTLNLNVNNTGATYLWQDNSTNSSFTVQQSGLYWVEVDINGCKERDSIQVIYQLSPNVDLGPDTTICQGNDLRLDVSQSGANYLWQDNSTSSIFSVQQSGLYWVEVDLNGCVKRDSIQVTFQSKPKVDLGPDSTICQGTNLVLDATQVGASYLWQDNSTNPIYTVQQAGLYWVEVDLNGCVDRDSIIISLETSPNVNLGNDTSVCQADFRLDATTANGSYVWHDNSTQATFHVTKTGLYWVEVVVNGCKARDSILVSSASPPTISLGGDKSLCIGETIWLNPFFNSLGKITWQDSIVANQLAVSDSGRYWVELKNDCGTASDTLSVFTEDCDCRVFMPNVFTPNQDHLNEKFEPVTHCNYLAYRIKIFNRWGSEIYKTDVLNEGWDGTVNGQNAPQGSYVYLLEYSNKVVVDKVLVGTFTLIR